MLKEDTARLHFQSKISHKTFFIDFLNLYLRGLDQYLLLLKIMKNLKDIGIKKK